jgi:hypothetical protein
MTDFKRGDIVEIIWDSEDHHPADFGMSGIVLPPLSSGFYEGENYLFLGHLLESPDDCIIQDERRRVHLWRSKEMLKKSDREFKFSRFV